MLLQIPDVLSAEQVAHARRLLDEAEWVDGSVTAGHQSARAKDNMQLPEDHPVGRAARGHDRRRRCSGTRCSFRRRCRSACFRRCSTATRAGSRLAATSTTRYARCRERRIVIRTDLSATLFLSDPAEYDGGELLVEDTYGVHSVKLPAGHLVLYPSTSLHHVRPVTRGARVCVVLLDSEHGSRRWGADAAVRSRCRRSGAQSERPDHPVAVQLTAVYHNLLRKWAEV